MGAIESKDAGNIHVLAQQGNVTELQKLLAAGAPLDQLDEDGLTALHYACYSGNFECVQALVEKNASLDVIDPSENTPIHFACQADQTKVVKYLLEQNNAINMLTKKAENGWTPFILCAQKGNVELMQLMVNLNVDIGEADHFGSSPLHWACRNGNFKAVQFLIEDCKAKFNKDNEGNSVLHAAASVGNQEILEFLIEKYPAGISLPNNAGDTPLLLASLAGHGEILGVLVRGGAKLTESDKMRGFTALHFAVEKDYLELVKFLCNIDKNVSGCQLNVNLTDINGRTALFYVKSLNTLQILVEDGAADVDFEDPQGKSPLHAACESGDLEMVKYLWEKSKRAESLSKSSHQTKRDQHSLHRITTLLHSACSSPLQDSTIIEFLAEQNLDLFCTDGLGNTPFDIACMNANTTVANFYIRHIKKLAMLAENSLITSAELKHLKIPNLSILPAIRGGRLDVLVLLAQNFELDYNESDPSGKKPIHFAAENGNVQVISKLIQMSCDPNSADTSGCTPLHYAARHGNCEAIELLLQNPTVEMLPDNQGAKPIFFALTNLHVAATRIFISFLGKQVLEDPNLPVADYSGIYRLGLFLDRIPEPYHGLRLLKVSCLESLADFPKFNVALQSGWLDDGTSLEPDSKVLYLSRGWSKFIDGDSVHFNAAMKFVQESKTKGKGFDFLWVDRSCCPEHLFSRDVAAQKGKESELSSMLAGLLASTHFLVLPETKQTEEGKPITDLKTTIAQPLFLLEMLTAFVSGSQIFCLFQFEDQTSYSTIDPSQSFQGFIRASSQTGAKFSLVVEKYKDFWPINEPEKLPDIQKFLHDACSAVLQVLKQGTMEPTCDGFKILNFALDGVLSKDLERLLKVLRSDKQSREISRILNLVLYLLIFYLDLLPLIGEGYFDPNFKSSAVPPGTQLPAIEESAEKNIETPKVENGIKVHSVTTVDGLEMVVGESREENQQIDTENKISNHEVNAQISDPKEMKTPEEISISTNVAEKVVQKDVVTGNVNHKSIEEKSQPKVADDKSQLNEAETHSSGAKESKSHTAAAKTEQKEVEQQENKPPETKSSDILQTKPSEKDSGHAEQKVLSSSTPNEQPNQQKPSEKPAETKPESSSTPDELKQAPEITPPENTKDTPKEAKKEIVPPPAKEEPQKDVVLTPVNDPQPISTTSPPPVAENKSCCTTM